MNKQELIKQIIEKKSFLCVGLDTDLNKVPSFILKDDEPIFTFNKKIIDATAPYCVSYKPNLAFYEAYGVKGLIAFEKTIKYLKEFYPKHFIIADAKRGDIGNTSFMYARTFFEAYDVDALTVAPYMGEDSIMPFLNYKDKDKWVVILALTSNKGSNDFQLEENKDGTRLFEQVLKQSQKWGNGNNIMYVVGATQGKMFKDVRTIAPDNFLLVPGVGAQGGSLEEVCQYGITKECGLLVNSSRGIIYASNNEDFASVAAKKSKELQFEMEGLLKKHRII